MINEHNEGSRMNPLTAVVTSDKAVMRGDKISFSTVFTSIADLGGTAFTYLISEASSNMTRGQSTMSIPSLKAGESVTVPFTFKVPLPARDGMYFVSVYANTNDRSWTQIFAQPKAYYFHVGSPVIPPVPEKPASLFNDDFNGTTLAQWVDHEPWQGPPGYWEGRSMRAVWC
jgi:hypothetical protein